MKPDPIQEAAGRQMRACMEAAGLRVGLVAQELGVKPQTVHAWFRGARKVSPEERQKLAALFGVDERKFYGSDGNASPRRETLTDLLDAMLTMFARLGQGEPPRVLELRNGGSVPLPVLTLAQWQQQLRRLDPALNDFAGGNWRRLAPAARQVFLARLVDYALHDIDHEHQEASE